MRGSTRGQRPPARELHGLLGQDRWGALSQAWPVQGSQVEAPEPLTRLPGMDRGFDSGSGSWKGKARSTISDPWFAGRRAQAHSPASPVQGWLQPGVTLVRRCQPDLDRPVLRVSLRQAQFPTSSGERLSVGRRCERWRDTTRLDGPEIGASGRPLDAIPHEFFFPLYVFLVPVGGSSGQRRWEAELLQGMP